MAYHHYADTERDDAIKVDRALSLIDSGQIDAARQLLEQVTANSPQFYVYDFGTAQEMCIKFWSLAEYLGYIALMRQPGEQVTQEVLWLKSAYPRAYYYLAQMDIAEGNDDAATMHLYEAVLLEPDHPQVLVAVAEIAARRGDHAKSLEQYDRALGSRPYRAAPVMVQMLAGKAKQLVMLGRHVEAEQILAQSLEQRPGQALAVNVQQYAQTVEAGNVTAPVSLEMPPELQCEDEPVQVGEDPTPVENETTKDVPPTKPKKHWWQRRK